MNAITMHYTIGTFTRIGRLELQDLPSSLQCSPKVPNTTRAACFLKTPDNYPFIDPSIYLSIYLYLINVSISDLSISGQPTSQPSSTS